MSYAKRASQMPERLVIHPLSDNAMGGSLRVFSTAVPTNQAWVANLAVYYPFTLDRPWVATRVFWRSGTLTAGGGTAQVGVYRASDLVQLVASSNIARATASAIMTADITDTYLPAGEYYLGFALNGTHNVGCYVPAAGLCQAMGVVEQTSAFALPGTATISQTTRAFVPDAGLTASGTWGI